MPRTDRQTLPSIYTVQPPISKDFASPLSPDSGYGSRPMSLTSSSSSYHASSSATSPYYSYNAPKLVSRHELDRYPNANQLKAIDCTLTPSVSNQKKGKGQRSNSNTTPPPNPSTTDPPKYHCLWEECQYSTERIYDLKRHNNGHSRTTTYPCPYHWCSRDKKPFSRADHLKVHLRNRHVKDIPKRLQGKEKEEAARALCE